METMFGILILAFSTLASRFLVFSLHFGLASEAWEEGVDWWPLWVGLMVHLAVI